MKRLLSIALTFVSLHAFAETLLRFDLGKILNRQDVENYLVRLDNVSDEIDQMLSLFESQKKKGVKIPPARLKSTIAEMEALVPAVVTDSILYTHLSEQIGKLKLPDEKELLARAATTLKTDIYPARVRLVEFLKQWLKELG
jgi:uncharacterized protein (DUF885 family)